MKGLHADTCEMLTLPVVPDLFVGAGEERGGSGETIHSRITQCCGSVLVGFHIQPHPALLLAEPPAAT